MTKTRAEVENDVVVGLLQDPKRLVELAGVQTSWFKGGEYRLAYWAARSYCHAAAIQGRIRYASTDAVLREAEAWVRRAEPDAKRSRRASYRSLVSLIDDLNGTPFVDEHAFRDAVDTLRSLVADDLGREGILRIAHGIKKSGSSGLSRELQRLAGEVSSVGSSATLVGEINNDAVSVYTDYLRAKKAPDRGRISTPFVELNAATEGGRRARLWLVAAYAKQGKTQLMKELLYHAAVECGRGVFCASGEQAREDMRDMFTVRHTHRYYAGGLPYRGVMRGQLDAEQERALRAATRDLASGKYSIGYFRAPGGTTVSELRAIAEARHRRSPIHVIGVDHTDLFEPTQRQSSDVSRLAKVIKELKDLSLEFDNGRGVWVIACHQIRREGYESALKRGYYIPSDMAGTAEAERSCDVMLWALRDDQMIESREVRLGVAIDRRGAGEPKGWACYERFECAALLPLEP